MSEPYDVNNIFAKILRGEMPSETVFEDDQTLVMMDIMPRCKGHALVLPKVAARNIFDVDTGSLAAVMATAQKVARASMVAFEADGVTVQQFNEPAGGQAVFHLHVHVIPRFSGEAMRPHTGEMADAAELKAHADQLRKALANA